MSRLRSLPWTLNLRGSDVQCNPVFLGYILLTEEDTVLFVDKEKLEDNALEQLEAAKVKVMPYEDFFSSLQNLTNQKVLLSPNTNQSVVNALKDNNQIIEAAVPGNLMKAQKNSTELEGFRKVMVKDGVAMDAPVMCRHIWVVSPDARFDYEEKSQSGYSFSFFCKASITLKNEFHVVSFVY